MMDEDDLINRTWLKDLFVSGQSEWAPDIRKIDRYVRIFVDPNGITSQERVAPLIIKTLQEMELIIDEYIRAHKNNALVSPNSRVRELANAYLTQEHKSEK